MTFASFGIISCKKKPKEIEVEKLSSIGSIRFELDSLTPDYFHGLEIFTHGNESYLTLLNDLTNTIYYYEFDSKLLTKTLSFKVGDEGIKKGIMTYQHIGTDSIFLFGKGLTSYMSDMKGSIISEYDIIDMSFRQSPYSTSNSPAIFDGNSIYYNSLVWGQYAPDYKPIMKYSIDRKSVELSDPLPSIYHQEGDWGSFSYDYIYQLLDKKNKRIIYSFPASNELSVRALQSDQLIPLERTKVFDPIKPPFRVKDYVYDSKEWRSTMNATPIFSYLLSDESNGILLRAYILPETSDLDSPKRTVRFIKYDLETLNIEGILELSDNHYLIENSFFKDSSLYIRRKIDNEDYIEFDKFELPLRIK